MDMKDLRYGNYVFSQETQKVQKIIGLTEENPVIDTITFDYPEYDEIEGVELTKEMVIKLGAVRTDFKQFPSFNLHGIQINFINGMWIEYVSQIEITGLHHLQNIYYFRMSEELKIDETILK